VIPVMEHDPDGPQFQRPPRWHRILIDPPRT
jgi:hypothetical protein